MKLFDITLFCCLLFIIIGCSSANYRTKNIKKPDETTEKEIIKTYNDTKLQDVIPFSLFRMGMIGFYNIDNLKMSDKLVIIDYSKPSTDKRFYVIDIEKKELLFNCLVSHGENSGENLATIFSNKPESHKSSLGFFITAETYSGKNGYSLRIDGIEKGINHNARKRDIVIHKANYVSQEFIKKHGRLGRSWGCPALPNDLSAKIIKTIVGGRCLFIYADNKKYLRKSKYILKRGN